MGGGPKIWKFGHVTQVILTWGSFYDPMQGGSGLYVCTKFEADSCVRSQVIRGGGLKNESHDPVHAHLGSHFVVRTPKGSVVHLRTEFETDWSIRFKDTRESQNFYIGSRDPGHAH